MKTNNIHLAHIRFYNIIEKPWQRGLNWHSVYVLDFELQNLNVLHHNGFICMIAENGAVLLLKLFLVGVSSDVM